MKRRTVIVNRAADSRSAATADLSGLACRSHTGRDTTTALVSQKLRELGATAAECIALQEEAWRRAPLGIGPVEARRIEAALRAELRNPSATARRRIREVLQCQ